MGRRIGRLRIGRLRRGRLRMGCTRMGRMGSTVDMGSMAPTRGSGCLRTRVTFRVTSRSVIKLRTWSAYHGAVMVSSLGFLTRGVRGRLVNVCPG